VARSAAPADPPSGGDGLGRRTFSVSFRGFDQAEVRAYLESLATEFSMLRERIAELELALESAPPPFDPPEPVPVPPVIDRAMITSALGEEAGRVLQAALDAAEERIGRANEEAEHIRRTSRDEATKLLDAAAAALDDGTAEAERAADAIRRDADAAAADVGEKARMEAEAIVAKAIEQGKDVVAQAQAARERILSDLSQRRRTALTQLDQARKGREQVTASLEALRSELIGILDDLSRADEEARRAAEAAGYRGPTPDVGAADLVDRLVAPVRFTGVTRASEPAPPDPVEVVVEPAAATPPAVAPVAPPVPAPVAEAVGPKPEAAAPPLSRPAYRHDPPPVGVLAATAVGAPPTAGRGTRRVDELFSRIRVDQAGASPPPDPKPPRRGAPRAPAPASAPEPNSTHVEASVASAAPAPSVSAVDDASLEAPRTDADEAHLERRDALLEAVLPAAVRAIKRAIADDQNLALDRLRTQRTSVVTVDGLLGGEAAQLATFAQQATPALTEAAVAGWALAGATPPGATPPGDGTTLVLAIAERLASDLVVPFRRRVADAVESVGGVRSDETVDRVTSAYREWRTRLDRATGDAVTEAVSAGFLAAVGSDVLVRWVVDDVDGPCPDCDDNALAGATPSGQPFPTGQVAPPAHAGCRCALART